MQPSRRTFLQHFGGALGAAPVGAGCGDDDDSPDARPPDARYTLTAAWVSTTLGGLNVKLRSYNGTVPGPTLTLRPGDRVEIIVDNQLTPYDSSAWAGDHNVPLDIPADQPSGFYGYHPHHHGSTAVQVVSGMAGAIVVPGPIDKVPAIAAARDIHLVISDVGLFPSDDEPDVWVYEPRCARRARRKE
jgi:suppressor of ftsI